METDLESFYALHCLLAKSPWPEDNKMTKWSSSQIPAHKCAA